MTTTTTAEPKAARRRMTQTVLIAEGLRRAGSADAFQIRFRCPACDHTQTAADLPAGRRLDVAQACFGCGRLAEDMIGPDRAALIRVTLPGGEKTDSFPLADELDADALSGPQTADGEAPGSGGPARDDIASAPVPAPPSAPQAEAPGTYWSIEHGWTDAPRINCSCHVSAPCGPCQLLQICAHCPAEVFVLEHEMDAHVADVHPEHNTVDAESEAC